MSSPFDPYYKWLGIPPREQPPNHYRLLGIELFEADDEVIEAATNRQMSYLQQLSSGENIEHAQKLLGEVSRARVCLINAKQKNEYDAKLRGELAAPGTDFIAEEFDPDPPVDRDRRKSPPGRAGEPPGFPGIVGDGPSKSRDFSEETTARPPSVPAAHRERGEDESSQTKTQPQKRTRLLIATTGLGVVACIAVGIFAFQHFSHRDAEQMLRAKSLVPNRDNTHWEHADYEAYRGLEQELKGLQNDPAENDPADQDGQQQTIKIIQQRQQELANIYQELRNEEEVRQALATLNANLAPPPGLSESTRELITRFDAERQQQQEEAERAKADRKKKAEAAKIAAADRKKKAEAKAEAAKIAEAERKKKAEAKAEAAKIAEAERKKKAKEKAEAAKIAEVERKAKEEPDQEFPKNQDNPESLLESKGLAKKGSKWVLAIEEPLQKRAQTLLAQWKLFNGLGRQLGGVDKKIATNFLLKRHELLEQTRSYHVMRAAVAEDYGKILKDEQIMAALEKLGQNTKSLPRTIKQYEKPDKKLMQVLPKGPPQLGNFVLLIINETTPVVIEQDTAALKHKEAKALLILPRAGWEAAGLPDGTLTQKWMHDQWNPHLWEVAVPSLRWGTAIARNAKAYRMHNDPANQDEAYGSRVGPVGWRTFLQQLRPAPAPPPTAEQIAEARTKLQPQPASKLDKIPGKNTDTPDGKRVAPFELPAELVLPDKTPKDDADFKDRFREKKNGTWIHIDEKRTRGEEFDTLDVAMRRCSGAVKKYAKAVEQTILARKEVATLEQQQKIALEPQRTQLRAQIGKAKEILEDPKQKPNAEEVKEQLKTAKSLANTVKAYVDHYQGFEGRKIETDVERDLKRIEKLKATFQEQREKLATAEQQAVQEP